VFMAGWVGRPAGQIAAAVRSGEVTAAEVVAGHLDRIARLNPELGAFVRVRAAGSGCARPWGRSSSGTTCC